MAFPQHNLLKMFPYCLIDYNSYHSLFLINVSKDRDNFCAPVMRIIDRGPFQNCPVQIKDNPDLHRVLLGHCIGRHGLSSA